MRPGDLRRRPRCAESSWAPPLLAAPVTAVPADSAGRLRGRRRHPSSSPSRSCAPSPSASLNVERRKHGRSRAARTTPAWPSPAASCAGHGDEAVLRAQLARRPLLQDRIRRAGNTAGRRPPILGENLAWGSEPPGDPATIVRGLDELPGAPREHPAARGSATSASASSGRCRSAERLVGPPTPRSSGGAGSDEKRPRALRSRVQGRFRRLPATVPSGRHRGQGTDIDVRGTPERVIQSLLPRLSRQRRTPPGRAERTGAPRPPYEAPATPAAVTNGAGPAAR